LLGLGTWVWAGLGSAALRCVGWTVQMDDPAIILAHARSFASILLPYVHPSIATMESIDRKAGWPWKKKSTSYSSMALRSHVQRMDDVLAFFLPEKNYTSTHVCVS
jgi:hypothetical protein